MTGYATSKKMSVTGSLSTIASRVLEGKTNEINTSPAPSKPSKISGIATSSSPDDFHKKESGLAALIEKEMTQSKEALVNRR